MILECVENILATMCPYKRVNTHRELTPWLTPAIYALIRENKALVKLYKTTKDPATLKLLRIKRNQVNNMIEKSKTEYITNSLNNTVQPKMFWKLIKRLIDKDDSVDITLYVFRHYDTGEHVNYLNDYFLNISDRILGPRDENPNVYTNVYTHVTSVFNFTPPNVKEIYGYIRSMDLNNRSYPRTT